MRKLFWDGISPVHSEVLRISGCESLTGSLGEKQALCCVVWSSNASYWKVSYSLKTPLTQVYLLHLGQLGLDTKKTGSVSEVGHSGVTVSSGA